MPPSQSPIRVADLRFQVYARALHPDWFAARAHRRVVGDGWDVDLRIIDGGHAVQWRSDGFRVTEVLAGPGTALPEPGLIFHSHLRHERDARLQPGGGIDYRTSFEVERCDAEVFDHLCEEVALESSRHALAFTFASANRLARSAVSLVLFEPRSNGLSVHTFHSFPAERAVVRTHSLLESRLALPAR